MIDFIQADFVVTENIDELRHDLFNEVIKTKEVKKDEN